MPCIDIFGKCTQSPVAWHRLPSYKRAGEAVKAASITCSSPVRGSRCHRMVGPQRPQDWADAEATVPYPGNVKKSDEHDESASMNPWAAFFWLGSEKICRQVSLAWEKRQQFLQGPFLCCVSGPETKTEKIDLSPMAKEKAIQTLKCLSRLCNWCDIPPSAKRRWQDRCQITGPPPRLGRLFLHLSVLVASVWASH